MAAIEDETLLHAITDSDFGFGPAPKALTGLALMGTSAELMRRQTPGGVRRLYADYASNYLNNFYKKNPLMGTKVHQARKYAWEGAKTGYRIARDATFGFTNSEFYNRTGVSPTLVKNIKDMEVVKDMANQKYLDNTINKSQAVGEIKKAQKVAFFKASSDKANRIIFLGKSSPELDRIVGDAVKMTNKKDFIRSMGGNSRDKRQIANYVLSRQTPLVDKGVGSLGRITKDNFRFIKYGNLRFADVLHGAQFDRNIYKAMLSLKRYGPGSDITGPLNVLKGLGIKNAQGLKGGNKLVFSISPSIRPNYDWGGYNSVAIWDRRRPGKIRFIATDVPDTPVPKTGGKIPGIKYVDSKEITINEKKLKEIFPEQTLTKEQAALAERRRASALKGWETRRANGWVPKTSKLGPRQIGDLGHNSVIGNSRYQELKNLNSKRAGFHISNARRFAKIGRRLPGAIGIALNAWALYDTFTNRDN